MSDLPTIETSFRVRYAETDAMGIVHHSNYIVYFEEGRSEFARQMGHPVTALEKMGFYLAVTDIQLRYMQPARYEQQLTVRTSLLQMQSRGMTFSYEIVDTESGKVLVTGQTRHICITADGKAARLPDSWRNWTP